MKTLCRAPRCSSSSQAGAAAAVAAVHVAAARRRVAAAATPASAAPAAGEDDEPQIPLEAANILERVRVVLVAPKTATNVGAVARACANFEAADLWLVAPRCDPADGEIAKVAAGAEQVLARLRVADSLQEALADTIGSVGFTRRAGATRYTHGSIADMLTKFPAAIAALDPALQNGQQQQQQQQQQPDPGITALVFGREESGLTEEELRLCSHACSIPTGRMQASMNLSHAVAVVLGACFERRLALLGYTDNPGLELKGSPSAREALQPAATSEVASLLAKVAAIAEACGVSGADSRGGGAQGSHGRRRLPLGHIRAVVARAQINTWEVRSLHGLASTVLAKLPQSEAAAGSNAAAEAPANKQQ